MITLDFTGDMSPERRAVFETAARRWDGVVNTGFDAMDVDGETLTGLVIEANIQPIDGAAGVLGQAGPTMLREDTGLPVKGIMQFDDADIARLEAEGSFADVILHEMAHVLGFGTLWAMNGLIAASGTNDPRFTGPAAAREFAALLPDDDPFVPIANTGGAGTREGHWRELIFGDELLTGFLSGTNRP
ncbi:MAG: leishmanolysin-related zinc metalloendopeptidase, partial [Pseudomonadota bacterium]